MAERTNKMRRVRRLTGELTNELPRTETSLTDRQKSAQKVTPKKFLPALSYTSSYVKKTIEQRKKTEICHLLTDKFCRRGLNHKMKENGGGLSKSFAAELKRKRRAKEDP